LTTKDQKNISREPRKPPGHHHHNPKATTTDARTDPGSYSWKLLLIKDARVHYVVLKQQPQTTHPTHNPSEREADRVIGAARKPETNKTHTTTKPPKGPRHDMALLPQDPTVCQTLPGNPHRPLSRNPRPRGERESVLTTGPCHQAPTC